MTKNYQSFIQAVDDVKKFLPKGGQLETESVVDLVKLFASTWFSIDAYDKTNFPLKGNIKKHIQLSVDELNKALSNLKQELIRKKEASDLFGQEKQKNSIHGIVGNVF